MTAATVHAKFFPQARPVCAFTREDIAQMSQKVDPPASADRAVPLSVRRETRALVGGTIRDRQIIADAAVAFEVTVAELIGPSRKKHLVGARRYAVTRLVDELGRSFHYIGDKVLRRDHSSIVNLYRPKTGKVW